MSAGEQRDFAAGLLDAARPPPARLGAWNGSDPARRFAVYRNNVVVGLTRALADTFPAVERLVGPEFFAAMAGVFVRAAPPRSPILAEYGTGFPDFVATFPPARELPYLADVARLECAMLEAYHAADAEPAAIAALGALPPEALGEARIALHPSVRLVSSPWAIATLVRANRAEAEVPPIDAGVPEDALVSRPHLEVVLRRLPPGGLAFLAALGDGANLAQAAGAGAQAAPDFDLAVHLAATFEAGIVASVTPGMA